MGKIRDAIHDYQMALSITPNSVEALNNLGHAYSYLDELDTAHDYFQKALAINPAYLQTLSNLGQLELLTNDYVNGWQHYLARASTRSSKFGTPPKFVESLNGLHIVLLQDQGIGDEIFFLRFVSALEQRGATITYQASAKLFPLLRNNDLFARVVTQGEALPSADITMYIADLPYALDMRAIADIPPPFSFTVDLEQARRAQQALKTKANKSTIGITWRAGVAGTNTLYKEIPLKAFAARLNELDARFVVLQRNPHDEEITQLRNILDHELIDLSDANEDLPLMLAILDQLDDYIGVSNTNMHLRAGLGKPARVLVSIPTDWRWQRQGYRSPWFPQFKVYRQSLEAAWQTALDEIIRDLKNI